MPEHLDEYTLSEGLRKLVKDLEEWLKEHGSFEDGPDTFYDCTSPGLDKQVVDLFAGAVSMFKHIRGKTGVRKYTNKIWINH